MSIGCQSFLKLLEQWAPVHYAEDWDNVGLHAGDRNKELNKIMVALSPGEAAVNAAVEAGVDMLLTHHPLIFRSMKQINSDTATGRSLLKLIRNDVNLYCAHTNLDIAKGGVNDVLAEYLTLQNVRPLDGLIYDETIGEDRGIGRVGTLPETMTLAEFLDFTGSQLSCDHMTYQGDLSREIKTVALCGGSGLSYLGAAKKAGADVYVTGDMRYHDAQAANELDLCVVDAGHLRTERMIVDALAAFARKQGLEVIVFDELEQDYLKHWTK